MAVTPALVLTNKGKQTITGRLKGLGNEPKYIAIGTGGDTQTASATVTTLQLQVGSRSGANVGTLSTTSVANDTYNISQTLTASTFWLINEAAVFDASSSGNTFIAATFTAVALSTGDQIQLTFSATVT